MRPLRSLSPEPTMRSSPSQSSRVGPMTAIADIAR